MQAIFFLTEDVNELLLWPMERMIIKVNMITNDPIGYRDDKILKDDEEFLKKKLKGKNEMAMLEAVINKIGGLLALGFGQAGSHIITTNLRN